MKKGSFFLSQAVSDEFLDDFENAVPETDRTGIKFSNLATKHATLQHLIKSTVVVVIY